MDHKSKENPVKDLTQALSRLIKHARYVNKVYGTWAYGKPKDEFPWIHLRQMIQEAETILKKYGDT